MTPWLQPFLSLSSTQKDLRHRSLQIRNDMFKGKTLTEASRLHGIKYTDVKKNLGKYLYQKGKRWFAKKNARIQRARWFFSKGKRITVIIDNDKTASLISKYLNEVKFTLRDGNTSRLELYKKIKVIDIYGKKHSFEIDFTTLQELDEMIEDPEFLPIYDDRI